MVRSVPGFAADCDNQVFSTHSEAARHEAEVKLKKLDAFRPETINAIINNAPLICDALNSLLDEPTETEE